MNSPIEVLIAVTNIGGSLRLDETAALLARLPRDFPKSLTESIKRHKPALVELLRLNFLLVRSDALKTNLFWTPDDRTKNALLAAGAEAGSIYTASELGVLVNRRVTGVELTTIHEAKQVLSGNLRAPENLR
jgi:hypothetical protein